MEFSVEPASNEPFEFGPIQTKWLEALESGKYKQGMGRLRCSGDNKYCCLGVLCEVAGLEYAPENSSYFFPGPDGVKTLYTGYLPPKFAESIGLRSDQARLARSWAISGERYGTLTGANDSGEVSFAEIAAHIRHDPWNVFTKSA